MADEAFPSFYPCGDRTPHARRHGALERYVSRGAGHRGRLEVTVAGSNGDLYKALQTLPGVQVQGETGRLLVRGAGTPRLCSAGSTWLRAVRRWSMSGCM